MENSKQLRQCVRGRESPEKIDNTKCNKNEREIVETFDICADMFVKFDARVSQEQKKKPKITRMGKIISKHILTKYLIKNSLSR